MSTNEHNTSKPFARTENDAIFEAMTMDTAKMIGTVLHEAFANSDRFYDHVRTMAASMLDGTPMSGNPLLATMMAQVGDEKQFMRMLTSRSVVLSTLTKLSHPTEYQLPEVRSQVTELLAEAGEGETADPEARLAFAGISALIGRDLIAMAYALKSLADMMELVCGQGALRASQHFTTLNAEINGNPEQAATQRAKFDAMIADEAARWQSKQQERDAAQQHAALRTLFGEDATIIEVPEA